MAENVTVTLTGATAHLVRSLYDESRRRGERETRGVRSVEAYIEDVLLPFAHKRKISEFQSHDKQAVGTTLRVALDKANSGKALNAEETKLVAVFFNTLKAQQEAAEKP